MSADKKPTRTRHSYVPFYMNDWAAATADMPRIVWSVLFQVCQYNWDKVEPVPHGRLKIMVADLPNGEEIVNVLVEAGSLEVTDKGIFSPRAILEAERALDIWQRKSGGGRKSKGGDKLDNSANDSDSLPTLPEDSSKSPGADQDQEHDQEIEEEDIRPNLDIGRSLVLVGWNEMARRHGLKQVVKMTAERIDRLDARITEHGAEALVAGINMIPTFPFLLGQGENGWRASFDWFLRPDSFAHVVEGDYEPHKGKTVQQQPTGPMNAADAAKANERLGEIGSGMRWRLEAGSWLLKPGQQNENG
jgi:hypothetical protein